jgi:hypothetical protein
VTLPRQVAEENAKLDWIFTKIPDSFFTKVGLKRSKTCTSSQGGNKLKNTCSFIQFQAFIKSHILCTP